MSSFDIVHSEIESYVNAGYPSEPSIKIITEGLIDCWRSPHSAMEMLLVAAEVYPLAIANKLVYDVVSSWKRKSDYSWDAGGSADHCFLSALAFTANGALADDALFRKKGATILELHGRVDEKRYANRSIQDHEAKVALLREFVETGRPVSLAQFYKTDNFDRVSHLIIPDFNEINAELIAYFAAHPERLQKLDWRKFEELLNAVFKNQGYFTELGPGRGDGGVDLRLIQKDSIGEILTLVQAKRYRDDNPIDLQAVQALHGVVDDQRAHRGLFVTTSRYLPVAQEFAKRQNGRLVLADSKDVAAWCKSIARR